MSNQTLQPREKLLRQGAQSLSDTELLAIFLRTGIKGKPVNVLACEMLNHFGDIRKLVNSNPNQFCQIKGLGKVKWIEIQAAIELSKRYYYQQQTTETQALTNPQHTIEFLQRQLRDKKQEVFAALFLDSQHRVLSYEELFHGTIDMTSIHARPIIERVMHHNAAAIIIAHNHPSGHPKPSQFDLDVTAHLHQTLKLIDTRLLDHVIIGDNQYHSMAQHYELNFEPQQDVLKTERKSDR